jgi:hypothetical protein
VVLPNKQNLEVQYGVAAPDSFVCVMVLGSEICDESLKMLPSGIWMISTWRTVQGDRQCRHTVSGICKSFQCAVGKPV